MIKGFAILLSALCFGQLIMAQTPRQLIAQVNQKFAKVNDYSADLEMKFDIPAVKIENISGKVFYKRPDKFRIRTKGIIFLPKQNPYYSMQSIADTNSFMAVATGTEVISGVTATVVNVIPNNNNGDLILGKFWIDAVQKVILKSQLTTKSNGTIGIENTYGNKLPYALPDKIIFTIDVAKFKIPKALAVDINSKTKAADTGSAKGVGVISLRFGNYAINTKLKDTVFTEP